ncbi:MAG: RnfABCDGE type electron transport complex subunit G [Epulopiscium sp.]|nr:RnfABCDGE type electron transport complex subunit G [Candidatus Epulonipiscium sp.]
MNDIVRVGFILCIITVLSGFAISGVYEITKEPIAIQKEKAQQEAMETVLKGVDHFELVNQNDAEIKQGVLEIHTGYQKDQIIGYVMKVVTRGYGGNMELMVGIDQGGVIQGVKILGHSETPGLGANAQEPEFLDQYKGKSTEQPLSVIKGQATGEAEIEAITSATITAEAVTSAINEARSVFKEQLN